MRPSTFQDTVAEDEASLQAQLAAAAPAARAAAEKPTQWYGFACLR
jgi:hypothetical protein